MARFGIKELITADFFRSFFIMYLVEETVHTYLRKRQVTRQDSSKKDVNLSTNELVENGQIQSYASNGHAHT